jgi:hypothetical protein
MGALPQPLHPKDAQAFLYEIIHKILQEEYKDQFEATFLATTR